ncbi:MAG TPA: dNTP triphosphohydrolase [bacterium]|nr:dNTP triphosphohydrolase [bacterium]HPN42591.1 dNTP triphosphohydrolase [bacterium]
MKNTFYNDFDFETREKRGADYRSPFQIDRDRIIHSFSFRRLQAKTQVFFSGEYDFYRTRLTHSMEVAQIGRSICSFLLSSSPLLKDDYFIDQDLVEAACLSHDLGHPPFGHAGEEILNKMMHPWGGFEGNAQTLRILTRTIYSSKGIRKGMNPSRAFIDSILKYKFLYDPEKNLKNHFLYQDQKEILDFAFNNRPFPQEFDFKRVNSFRSIECQIMDWSDDTSYSLNDMVDSIKTGFITIEKVENWEKDNKFTDKEHAIIHNVLEIIRSGSVESLFARKIGEFIKACRLIENETFMSDLTNRHRYTLQIDPDIRTECELYKRLSRELVFDSPQISQLEFKGHFMLKQLFSTLLNNYISPADNHLLLLPMDMEDTIQSENLVDSEKVRILCDYIAGMTDRYAVRFYKRLFIPDYGSIVDLV